MSTSEMFLYKLHRKCVFAFITRFLHSNSFLTASLVSLKENFCLYPSLGRKDNRMQINLQLLRISLIKSFRFLEIYRNLFWTF